MVDDNGQPIASLPMRGEWIEIVTLAPSVTVIVSLPMRGEWIEIGKPEAKAGCLKVSPHAGRVD